MTDDELLNRPMPKKLTRKRNKSPANQLSEDIWKYVKNNGWYSVRINVIGLKTKSGKWRPTMSTPGVSDRIAINLDQPNSTQVRVRKEFQYIPSCQCHVKWVIVQGIELFHHC